MTPSLAPTSAVELAEAVCAAPQVVAVGAGTKPRLTAADERFTRVSLLGLKGITEYEPEEYTITALAGTRVRELSAALAEKGQYLPFDPLYADAGTTLGGCIASGANGPGRFRFGGARDFILGIRFVDGAGRLLRLGGKVVKNAAGFDLPKFFVGSLGRFGVLAEVTLKVFPRPPATVTVTLDAATPEGAAQILIDAARAKWDLDALDVLPGRGGVCLRLAGPVDALDPLAGAVCARWPGCVLPPTDAEALWTEVREGRWAHSDGLLIKISLTPAHLPALTACAGGIERARVHFSAGGNVAFLSLPNGEGLPGLDALLKSRGLTGLTFRGDAPLWTGLRRETQIASAVKIALDPVQRFPAMFD
jgi:glycolate oxidase FAD binding subunit